MNDYSLSISLTSPLLPPFDARAILFAVSFPPSPQFVAAQAKRMGQYLTYVVFHSLWHLGSALAIYLYFAHVGRGPGASHGAEAEKPVGGGYFW